MLDCRTASFFVDLFGGNARFLLIFLSSVLLLSFTHMETSPRKVYFICLKNNDRSQEVRVIFKSDLKFLRKVPYQ